MSQLQNKEPCPSGSSFSLLSTHYPSEYLSVTNTPTVISSCWYWSYSKYQILVSILIKFYYFQHFSLICVVALEVEKHCSSNVGKVNTACPSVNLYNAEMCFFVMSSHVFVFTQDLLRSVTFTYLYLENCLQLCLITVKNSALDGAYTQWTTIYGGNRNLSKTNHTSWDSGDCIT